MIYVVPGHSLLYVAMLIDKTLGKGSYSVVSSTLPLKKKSSIFLVDGFNTYKSRLSNIKFGYRVAILIFDSPFKIEESLPCVDMDIVDLNSTYRPLPFSIPDPEKGTKPATLLNLNAQTIKAVEFFTVSSVMDKAITFIYRCSSNRTRPKVRKVIFGYIIGDITKNQVMEAYAKDIRRATLEKGVDLLMAIFDWMETEKGSHFRSVLKTCIGKSDAAIKEIADREGVDRFDINTMLINMKQE